MKIECSNDIVLLKIIVEFFLDVVYDGGDLSGYFFIFYLNNRCYLNMSFDYLFYFF